MSTTPADRRPEPPAFRAEGRPHELARVLRRKRRLRAGTVQLLGAAAAVGLAFLAPQVHIGFDIPTTRAIEMLIAVGAGTVTFIGIVFSLLFLVVQFASTTFSRGSTCSVTIRSSGERSRSTQPSSSTHSPPRS